MSQTESPKIQLSFSGTFPFRREEISNILKAASEPKGIDDSKENLPELSARLGLNTPKIPRVKKWAMRAGLVDKKSITPMGQVVLTHDPFLNALETQWLIHFNLSFGVKSPLDPPPSDVADWGGWTWFSYDYLPNHPNFTFDELVGYASNTFNDPKDKIKTNLHKFVLKTYLDQSSLGLTGYITEKDPGTYTSENRQLPNPYLIGYCLAQLWQRDFPDTTSILTQDLLNQPLGLAPALSLSPNQLQDTLNTLEYHHILEQRLAVAPFQLIRRWQTPIDLLHKAYTA